MKDIFDRTYFRPFEKSGNKHITIAVVMLTYSCSDLFVDVLT